MPDKEEREGGKKDSWTGLKKKKSSAVFLT